MRLGGIGSESELEVWERKNSKDAAKLRSFRDLRACKLFIKAKQFYKLSCKDSSVFSNIMQRRLYLGYIISFFLLQESTFVSSWNWQRTRQEHLSPQQPGGPSATGARRPRQKIPLPQSVSGRGSCWLREEKAKRDVLLPTNTLLHRL